MWSPNNAHWSFCTAQTVINTREVVNCTCVTRLHWTKHMHYYNQVPVYFVYEIVISMNFTYLTTCILLQGFLYVDKISFMINKA